MCIGFEACLGKWEETGRGRERARGRDIKATLSCVPRCCLEQNRLRTLRTEAVCSLQLIRNLLCDRTVMNQPFDRHRRQLSICRSVCAVEIIPHSLTETKLYFTPFRLPVLLRRLMIGYSVPLPPRPRSLPKNRMECYAIGLEKA